MVQYIVSKLKGMTEGISSDIDKELFVKEVTDKCNKCGCENTEKVLVYGPPTKLEPSIGNKAFNKLKKNRS